MEISFITLAATATSSANYEQMASAFKIVSIVLFILAAVCLAFGIFAFITFKIPTIIGDLTGRNAKKSIEQMRESNEKGGNKSYRPHPVASDRGTLTEPIKSNKKESKKLSKNAKIPVQQNASPNTPGSGPTNVFEDTNATVKLDYDANGTEILNGGTEVLSEETMQAALDENMVKIKMIQNIVLVNTEEEI